MMRTLQLPSRRRTALPGSSSRAPVSFAALLLVLIVLPLVMAGTGALHAQAPAPGVGNNLARYRAEQILLLWKGHPHAGAEITRSEEEARDLGREIARKLRRGDAEFAALAKEYSSCPSKLDGGYLGQFRANEFHPDFIKALEHARTGNVIGPVRTPLGYVVFRRLPIEKRWPELLNLQHILISYKGAYRAPKDVARDKKQADSEVVKIIAELKTDRIDFDKAAQKYSDDARSRDRGGALGTRAPIRFITPSFVDKVLALKEGEIHGPIESPFGLHIVRRLAVDRPMRASHILITWMGAAQSGTETRSQEDARTLAEELLKKLQEGADFGELAAKHSSCPTGRSGGDLGEFRSGQWVESFETAVRRAPIGTPFGPIKTRFGYHLILRTQ
jgi:parvulin-like peptidyl-prolyl isomerase